MSDTQIPLARAADLTGVAQETTLQGVATDVAAIKTDVAALVAKYSSIVVTCVTQDDVTVTGQTVTLRGGNAEGPVYDTRPYNGQPVTFEVPRDFRYFVEVSSTLSGHFAPTTAQGTATTATVAVTLTYSDTSHITTYADVKGAMDSITTVEEGRAALVGIEIADTWTDEQSNTYSDPMIVVDVQTVKDAYNAEHLAALLMRKYTTKYLLQYDAAESGKSGYATEATAVGGIYYWGYGKDYAQATTYTVGAFCGHKGGIWKCTTAVTGSEAFDPAKWSLLDAKFYDASATYAVGDYARYNDSVYQCTTAISSGEEWDEDHWTQVLTSAAYQSNALVNISLSTGDSVPYSTWTTIYHTDISSSAKDYFAHGLGNWMYSAMRQYLGSNAPAGQWWNPAHVGDCPPNQLATVRGYKAGCSAALLQYAKPIQVPFLGFDGTPLHTIDQIWIPSATQMFGIFNEHEGFTFKKVQDNCYAASGWTTANNNSCSGRVYRRVSATATAARCWLRSTQSGSYFYTMFVGENGSIGGYYGPGTSIPYSSYAALPCCAIY